MKLNPKVFKSLVGEPVEVQEIDGIRVEFHYMNDTPYLAQFAARGRFAIWTSNGKDTYKVLIEKKYYEALKPFYEKGVNQIWLSFLTKVGNMSRKINLYFFIPTMLFALVAVGLFSYFLPDQFIILLVVMFAAVMFINVFQSRYINKKVQAENEATQVEIKKYVGEDVFNELVKNQEEFYQEYFKVEEPETPADAEENTAEVIDAEVEKEADSNDK